jgi:hypothetical protein
MNPVYPVNAFERLIVIADQDVDFDLGHRANVASISRDHLFSPGEKSYCGNERKA